MKLAIITDTHWGVRNDHPAFLENSKLFLDKVFFPTIEKLGITQVLHLGDLVDRRKYINIHTARRLREDFLFAMQLRNITFSIIAGNHDTYFKNTNQVNSLVELVYGPLPEANIFWSPCEWHIGGLKVCMVPWICDANRKETEELIRKTDAKVCFAHLELDGFEMYKGTVNIGGDDPILYGNFDAVYTGHYHHKSSRSNIHYLGSHGQFTWSDFDDVRGFHIFDTATQGIEFIENPYTMFAKIWYDDRDKTLEDIINQDYSIYNNKMVKVIVTSKTNPYWFDKFIDELEKKSLVDMQVVEDHQNLDLQDDEEIIDEAQSTIDIFRKYIETSSIPGTNKLKLEKVIEELYSEALSLE